MIVRLIIMTIIVLAVNGQQARASGAPSPSQAKGKSKASSDSHDASHSEAPAEAGEPTVSQVYVHRWISFPPLQGKLLQGEGAFSLKAQKGRVLVAVFLASWCLPCQELVKPLQKLEEKYEGRYTDFVYIFAHDTESDARGFVKEYKMSERSILASAPLLESFHQPELPSIYVADRYSWLVLRKLNTQLSDLAAIDHFLELQTAF